MIELVAMRPNDPRYNMFPLAEAPYLNATLNYVIARSPISDPKARYDNAVKKQRPNLIHNSETYFNPWDSIHEANPQEILDRGEPAVLVPMLVLQGAMDDNVMPETQAHFVDTYRTAGGEIDFEVFSGADHRWIILPSPQTDRAIAVIKEYIATRVNALQPVV